MEQLEPLQLFFNMSHLQYDSNVELSKYIHTFLLNNHLYIYVNSRQTYISFPIRFKYNFKSFSKNSNYFPLKLLRLLLYHFYIYIYIFLKYINIQFQTFLKIQITFPYIYFYIYIFFKNTNVQF